MCGIAGFTGRSPFLSTATLRRMNTALNHRGPDDSGEKTWRLNGTAAEGDEPACVGLAHRRLSVIDLSPAGHQPMSNEDGSVWITYNGEFYNFPGYRNELVGKGHVFSSHTDSETIIHLYEEHGTEETLRRMNGMFAFGLWDAGKRRMVLARDRVGKKPLYYMLEPDGSLIFASEMNAILESGRVDRERIDEVALTQFWTYGYIIGERTIYRQVRRLLPGHFGIWEDGRLTIKEYWDCPFGIDPFAGRTLDNLTDELESILTDAVRLRLISDVPLGVFLSGGIDSSLVAALVARVSKGGVRSFTIGYDDNNLDEAKHARKTAAHLGIENKNLTLTENITPRLMERIADHFGEPFGDSSAVPTYLVAQLARREVTVVLTGDGGDELFAGYDSYKEGLRLWGSRDQKRLFHRRIIGREWTREIRCRLTSRSNGLTAWEQQLGPVAIRKVLSRECLAVARREGVHSDRERWYSRVASSDILSRMQYINLKTYLPDDILVKVDRMSMAHALECRNPLLDHRIVEFAARLPYYAKIDEAGRGKVLLRHMLSRHVPPQTMDRRKQGFTLTIQDREVEQFNASVKAGWMRQNSPLLKRDAAGFLVSARVGGKPLLQWNGFSMLVFLESGKKASAESA